MIFWKIVYEKDYRSASVNSRGIASFLLYAVRYEILKINKNRYKNEYDFKQATYFK